MEKTFVGFGFGPIMSGLFLYEAFKSGNFRRFVVADVDTELVDKVREDAGYYNTNVAAENGIRHEKTGEIEIYNSLNESDSNAVIKAVAESDEIATALPSVDFYDRGGVSSVAGLISAGLQARIKQKATIIYTAENNNRAAEILLERLKQRLPGSVLNLVQVLNTVIGKMSGVIKDDITIKALNLTPVAPGLERAVLVEEFNRILISKVNLKGFRRGISVFQEKDELLPFEEAKLYGHNAVHALIAYLADLKGYRTIAEAGKDKWIMQKAHDAFIKESGKALIAKYGSTGDPLFTESGYRDYAEDLLKRMVNRFLNDRVERVGRDRPRKLGINDRIYGTMILALKYGIEPENLALGAAAGIISMIRRGDTGSRKKLKLPLSSEKLSSSDISFLLYSLWQGQEAFGETEDGLGLKEKLIALTYVGYKRLKAELPRYF